VLNHVETGQDVGVAVSLRRRVLAVLGLTQTVSWGVLYYAFPAQWWRDDDLVRGVVEHLRAGGDA
jgi:hypothetical protein